MAARLSTRISLRWVPDEPEELTNTLVMNVVKCRWIKAIDSLGPSDPDEGIFSPLPNGDDLETGSMPCAHKNDAVTDYEEVWRKLDLVPGPKRAWIIQTVEDSSH
ncbi:hypothetical protein VE04_10028, partial [Pseudogymnoascus sp. 24MN13]